MGDQDLVAAALAKAFASVQAAIPKDGTHDQGWNFTSEAAIAAHVRPHLADNGLMVVPIKCVPTYTTEPTGRRDMKFCRVVVTYRIYHSSGQCIEVESFGEAFDAGDKSAGKAQTMAYKTLWLELFCLARGVDPDEYVPPDDPMRALKDALDASEKAGVWTGPDLDDLLKRMGVERFSQVAEADLPAVVAALQGKPPVREVPWSQRVAYATRAAKEEGWTSADFDALLSVNGVSKFSELDPDMYDAIITALRGGP